jgi:Mrp family chromosome partitioning ATPase
VIHTLERLQDAGGRILGMVLNRAQIEKHSYYYSHYYGHYYGRDYGKYQDRPGPSKVPRQRPLDGRAPSKVASINRKKAAR